MSYIDKNLLPDERILFRTKKHLILFFYPVVMLVFSMFATRYMLSNPLLVKVVWGPWVITILFWAQTWIEYNFSEYVVTNKRVMMREGFFIRHANEMRLSAISQVNVDQNLLGQLLDYGIVALNAFGAYDTYPLISRPFLFQKAVNEQLDQLVR